MNWDHSPSKRLIAGMSGSGKTTLLLRILRDSGHPWKFVYDPHLETARKLNWQAAGTMEGLCQLFDAKRPVVFYPGRLFPSDCEAGLDFFCQFVMAQAKRREGPKLLAIDELQECTSQNWQSLPDSFKAVLNVGRREEIDLIMSAQSVNDVNAKVRRQVTEVYIFKQSETDFAAMDALGKMGIAPETVNALPHPSQGRVGWIYRNLLTGQTSTVIQKCT